MTKHLKVYGLLYIIFAAIGIYYSSYLSMPLVDDEIAAYGIPALKLKFNYFKTLLPWNYVPQDFYGHPPLNTAYFAFILRFFSSTPESLRIGSLVLSFAGLLAFLEIGKTLQSIRLGYFLICLWLCHFLFWENAYLIFADNLFHTLFLFFTLAYFRNSTKGLLLLGLAMILTRETALVPLAALWGMETLKKIRKEKNHFILFSFLILAQLSWFFYLWIEAGSATPVYHHDGFIFDINFILKTLWQIVSTNFIFNWWVVTFLALFLVPAREAFNKYWGFILVTLTLILGLTTITASISRYQMIGISSWIIFLGELVYKREIEYSNKVKNLLLLVMGILFIRNFYIGHNMIARGNSFQKKTYFCAQRIKEMDLKGKVRIGGWPIYEIVTSYNSLQTLKWTPELSRSKYLYFDSQYSKLEDYDYFVTFNFGQNAKNRNYFNELKNSLEHELIPGTDSDSDCLFYRKLK